MSKKSTADFLNNLLIMERVIYLIICFTCGLCERLELPAYEYLRRFNQQLYLGQCANRIVQYPQGPYAELCPFPKRRGKTESRFKEVHSRKLIPIHDASHLMHYLGMCDAKSAEYFGLLAKGDCVAADIAGKMSFKPKTVTWVYLEHFRPRINTLKPEPVLADIPEEYTLYLNNTYYTENIGIGTEEVIIVQMMFRSVDEAKKAYSDRYTTQRLSEKLLNIARSVAAPRKVKVIRLSTSEEVFKSRNFKRQFAIFDAVQFVEGIEKQISRIRQELQHGLRSSHLKYSFKAYEIGPNALPMSTVSQEDMRKNWKDVALLQVEAKRTYTTNRRYRKVAKMQD
ncbi:uncharacterized protein LOC123554809 isoform X2 [Mercenaria mercenaria]|uniref:uncharacterized protein LOC123554809 isoform X2 n=1 Tax=Mercenaria mercenaria TaxID=6596 RepID=UPI00234F8BA4|nr:uncharacterized protein LOC123554809 isoform X2 [Mercenaria mercenaria]